MASKLQKIVSQSVAGSCACKEARNVYLTTLLESWSTRYSVGNLKKEASEVISKVKSDGLTAGQLRNGAIFSFQLYALFWIGKAFGQGSISGVKVKVPAGRNEH
mmetsp:Transcript_25686/g.36091  ORF Transcript_25686/g.36091 Transcript_25686/m.36091 type:complete len:104 (+) Transcript_25686:72-383(+)